MISISVPTQATVATGYGDTDVSFLQSKSHHQKLTQRHRFKHGYEFGASDKVIARANALLHCLASSPVSASRLLGATTPKLQKDKPPSEVRRRRSGSHQSFASHEDMPESKITTTCAALLDDTPDFWQVVSAATLGDQSSYRRSASLSREISTRVNSGRPDPPVSDDPERVLHYFVSDSERRSDVESDKVEEWQEYLKDAQEYDSDNTWLIMEVLTKAWRTERCSASSKVSIRPPSEADGFGVPSVFHSSDAKHLHLAQQLRSEHRSQLPCQDVACPLDTVFSGLFPFDAWRTRDDDQYRASTSQLVLETRSNEQRRRHGIAAELLFEICSLSDLAVCRDALVRGIFERLALVSHPPLSCLLTNFASLPGCSPDPVQCPRQVLADACIKHLDLENWGHSPAPDKNGQDFGNDSNNPLALICEDDEMLARRELLLRLKTFVDAGTLGKDLRRGFRTWSEAVKVDDPRTAIERLRSRLRQSRRSLNLAIRTHQTAKRRTPPHAVSRALALASQALALGRRLDILFYIRQVVLAMNKPLGSLQNPQIISNAALKIDLSQDPELIQKAFTPAMDKLAIEILQVLEDEEYLIYPDAPYTQHQTTRSSTPLAADLEANMSPIDTAPPTRKSAKNAQTPQKFHVSTADSNLKGLGSQRTYAQRPEVQKLLVWWLLEQAVASVETVSIQLDWRSVFSTEEQSTSSTFTWGESSSSRRFSSHDGEFESKMI